MARRRLLMSAALLGTALLSVGCGGGGSQQSPENPLPAGPAPPAAVAINAGDGQVALIWAASAGAAHYNVKRATMSAGPYTQMSSPSTTSYNDTLVSDGTTYYYEVSAVDSAGEGANSQPVSATPAAPGTGSVTVDATAIIAPISATLFGTNLAVWFDITNPVASQAIAALGAQLVRWPGGSFSDGYHWQTNTQCGGGANGNSTFDNFMNGVAIPNHVEVAITVNYGSNADCNGGGDPTEAAAWVAYAVSKGYNAYVHHYTVGNENYGSWEMDLHAKQWDPGTYATAVGTATGGGYYQQMKAQDPAAKVGVVVQAASTWDTTVLSQAAYDFVELHQYPGTPGAEADTALLTAAPASITAAINTVRTELAAAGHPDTPIFVGEYNSVYSDPGKQSLSIVNGLFAGETLGELLNDNIPMAAMWIASGDACRAGLDTTSYAAGLYGWQNFGSYTQVSHGWAAGACNTASQAIAAGTLLPSAYAQQLAATFATEGNSMLTVSVGTSLPEVRAYAATSGSGYALMLFNLDPAASYAVTVDVTHTSKVSFTASALTYGKLQYDDSINGQWTAPVAKSLGTLGAPVTLTLPPWSMTVLKLQ